MAASVVSVQSGSRLSAKAAAGHAKVLILDADAGVLNHLRNSLVGHYAVTVCGSGKEALALLKEGLEPQVVLLDTDLLDGSGLDALKEIRSLRPFLKIIVMSCNSEPRQVVQAMRLGARDYLQKPVGQAELEQAIRGCLGFSPATVHAEQSKEIVIDERVSFVHSSKRMGEISAQCSLVARVDLPVLILGESGTGKEVIAQYIHKMSLRGNKMFLKVNCAAMPADLLESELFGYEQGAFTGAMKSKPGKFEMCNQGTILLDEIGEMPPALQAKLLQVLQDGSFSRLGSRSSVRVDVRVIAATNIDMKTAILHKTFREDLYYRLNGFTLTLPPLRERKEEIPVMLEYFMRKLGEKYGREPLTISAQLMNACMGYEWPGNLRELENFVKRYLVLADDQAMIHELLPMRGAAPAPAPEMSGAHGLKGLVRSVKDDAEAVAIARALEITRWNRKQAADELKISYKALLYKIRQYNLIPPVA